MTPDQIRTRDVIAAVLTEQLDAAPTPARRAADAVLDVINQPRPWATPERCGQRHITYRERAGLPNIVYVCALADQHSGEFHRSDDGSTWSHAGNLQGPPAQVPDTAGTLMDAETQRRLTELESLAAPSENGALNLGPIVERQRLATNDRHYHNDIAASQADVLPLVREVMRLRRPKPAMPGDVVQRSALSGISEQLDSMTRVFAELRNAVDSTDRLREAVRAEIVATVHYGHTPTLDECTHHQCVALRKAAAA